MKNLKKSLALVLAIALVFSLVVFANAEFTDAEDINPKYTDAVGVMNGLGIIKGYDTGAFGPQDTLTRDQGAKIITMIKMGKASSTLPTNQVFNDVPADNWAAPYVAYAASKNIINGYGDGNFGPGDKLSGYAFGKMLFVTLGYGQNNEFTGGNWKIAVAEVASETGLFAGLEDYLSDDPLPREVAAQLAFNAMGTPMVQYLKSDDIYEAITPTKTLAASVQDLNMTPVPGATDLDGRPTKTYVALSNPAKVIYETTAEPVATIIDGSFDDTKFETEKKWNYDEYNSANGYMDRDSGYSVSYFEDEPGTVVEFYGYLNAKTGETMITGIVGTRTYFATVGKIDAKNKVITLYWNADSYYDEDFSEKTEPNSYKLLSGFEVGDALAITIDYATSSYDYLVSAEKATAIEGAKVTAVASDQSYIKIDGKQQNIGYKYGGPVIGSDITAGYEIKGAFYADKNGYVIGFVGETAPAPAAQTDFVYVVAYQATAGVPESTDVLNPTPAKPATAKAEVILTDGTHKAVDLAIGKTGDFTAPKADGSVETKNGDVAKTTIGNWFAFSEADGVYTLEAVKSEYAKVATADVTLVKGTPYNASGVYTTSTTKVVTIDTKYAVKEETGLIAATLKYDAVDNAILITKAGSSAKTVDAIYAVGQTPATPIVTKTYAYAKAAGDAVEGGTEWTFYINGAAETYVIKSGETVDPGEVYTLTKDPSKDIYTVAKETKVETAGEIAVSDATFIVVGSNTYNIAATTSVFDVRPGHTGEAGTLAVGLKVDVIEAAPGTAAVIYIVG